MLDATGLINKHRSKGVLVDTNLLVLYLVGLVNPRRISQFKRTDKYSIEDFELLARLISLFGGMVTTPHVLSQTSDLADLSGKEFQAIRQRFRSLVANADEQYEKGLVLVADPDFERLGLADAAIAAVCKSGCLVLTDDLTLHLTLASRGADALNFNHLRELSWR